MKYAILVFICLTYLAGKYIDYQEEIKTQQIRIQDSISFRKTLEQIASGCR